MTVGESFDILLCLLVVAAAGGAIAARNLFTGVSLFVVYGLLLSLVWVRLGAIDVALAEAAIGAGLTGLLLLGAISRMESGTRPLRLHLVPIVLCFGLAIGLGAAALSLPRWDAGLRPLVEANLAKAGADNAVTSVLLEFRGYDTLLETVVLLIALVTVWSLSPDDLWGGRPGVSQQVRPDGVLATFGRFLPPLGLIVGIYLVWAGTSAPGGAFQGGTVLAAVWLLSIMAAVLEPPRVASSGVRWLLIAGPLLFLAAGLFGLREGAFLAYPSGASKPLIILIEFVLALSVAVTLALLVLGPPRRAS